MDAAPKTPAEAREAGRGVLMQRMVRWLRRKLGNNLEQDWAELNAMTDDELCREHDRLLNGGHVTHDDRFRRCCYIMSNRFYERVKYPPNEKLSI